MFLIRSACPICSHSDTVELYTAPFAQAPIGPFLEEQYAPVGHGIDLSVLGDAQYCLHRCPNCELVFQKNIPGDELMHILYERWIDADVTKENHRVQDDVNLFNGYANEISLIVDMNGKIPDEQRFLDFGMGWAKWACMAKAFGVTAEGCELSEKRIENARQLGVGICDWDDIPGGNYDFINTEQVYEHIGDPLETLCHLKQGLASGGLIKISVPPSVGIDKRLQKMNWKAARGSKEDLNAVFPLEHINCYKWKTFEVLADKAGMEIVSIPMRKQYRYTSNWRSAKAIARNLIVPIYRNVFKLQNYVFLRSQ